MCVLAGYVGERQAAPLLLEMLEREEGLGGGYYTGIATIHEGRLYCEKTVGDVAALRRRTNAEHLPGTIGIAHSRTPSGGGREWAHPFVDCAGRLAYVAQGAPGRFRQSTDLAAAAARLREAGHRFLSLSAEAVGDYPCLPGGGAVHLSEVMCHAIEDAYRRRGSLAEAAAAAYEAWPGEIVGLALHVREPESVTAMRVNQPLAIARGNGETFLATTSIAFPKGAPAGKAMPRNAAATVTRGDVTVRPFERALTPALPEGTGAAVMDAVGAALRAEGLLGIGALCARVERLFPEGHRGEAAALVYESLAAYRAAGLVKLETDRVPAMFKDGEAPRTRVRWCER